MYPTVCPPSAVAQIDGRCIGEGVALLFGAAPVGILIDAEASTIRIVTYWQTRLQSLLRLPFGPLLNCTTSGLQGSSITTWQSSRSVVKRRIRSRVKPMQTGP